MSKIIFNVFLFFAISSTVSHAIGTLTANERDFYNQIIDLAKQFKEHETNIRNLEKSSSNYFCFGFLSASLGSGLLVIGNLVPSLVCEDEDEDCWERHHEDPIGMRKFLRPLSYAYIQFGSNWILVSREKDRQKHEEAAQVIAKRNTFVINAEQANQILDKLRNTPDLNLFKGSLLYVARVFSINENRIAHKGVREYFFDGINWVSRRCDQAENYVWDRFANFLLPDEPPAE